MEKKKIVMTLSKAFPASHSRCGEPTCFEALLAEGTKIHTIRKNKNGVWDKRAAEINNGKKCLCVREWEGRPYHSEQREFARYERIGLQHVRMVRKSGLFVDCEVDGKPVPVWTLAANDGLLVPDFIEWFFSTNLYGVDVFEGVIIHFTDFRY